MPSRDSPDDGGVAIARNVWTDPTVARGRRAQDAALTALLDAGHDLVGWKVGVGTAAAMARADIDAPLVGYLTSATVLDPGATVAVSTWTAPMLEPELAIHLDADVPGHADPDQVADAVGGVAPAIELADVDVPLDQVETVLAGDVYHRHVVLGPVDRGRGARDVADLRVRVTRGGEEVAATDDIAGLIGDQVDLVTHVARWLDTQGRRLEAGQVVITGSTVPPIPVTPGDDLVYRCDPIGTLAIRIR